MIASTVIGIEGFTLRCDLKERAGNARVFFDQRSAFLVKLTTASGHVGWGESWAFPEPVAEIVRTRLGPALLGADPSRPSAAVAPLLDKFAQDRRGLHHMALSALDIALWDAFGHMTGRPVHDLLGGARRNAITAYASGPLLKPGADPYAGLENALKSYIATGFRAFKLRLGIDRASDAAALRTAREIIGPDALLMADLNEASSMKEAAALARAVEDVELAWLEEPVMHDNLAAYARMTAGMPVPVAGGESLYGVGGFRDMLAQGAIDIAQPDLALCGGFGEARKIAALAEAFGVPVAPHVWGTGVNYLAALQFSASLAPGRIGRAQFPLHEIDVADNPLLSCMLDIALDAEGRVAVPSGPGLGMEIEPDKFREFIVDQWSIG